MRTDISIASTHGSLRAAFKEGGDHRRAVVILHEWWGINENIVQWVDRFAEAGFAAIAPDLYGGQIARTATEAEKLMHALDWDRALEQIASTVKWIGQSSKGGRRAVGTVGFCMGGALALASACAIESIQATVAFYGIPPLPYQQWRELSGPVQAHFSTQDEWAKADTARQIQQQCKDAKKTFELFVYDAPHAFMNASRPEVYNPACAKIAWKRTVDFFEAHLNP